MIDLSVIVVSFETRALLLECLTALKAELDALGARCGLTSEVCVVDNASCDGSAAAVAAAFPDVTLIERAENGGFAVGANAGLAQTSGRVALLLNSDTRVVPGGIGRCLDVLDTRPDAGVVGPQMLHPDGRLQNSTHAFPSIPSELVPGWLPRLARAFRRRRIDPHPVDAVLGAALFVRRAVVESVGGLPEAYFFFLEETDWCWQIRAADWEILHVPEARFVHVSGASSKKKEPARTRIEFHRSLYRFMAARRGAGAARAAAVIRCVRALGTGIVIAPLAPFSARQRARLGERARLVAWHAAGRPPGWGLAPGGRGRAE